VPRGCSGVKQVEQRIRHLRCSRCVVLQGRETLTDLEGSEVVTMARKLAQKEHSASLEQLASRISAIVKFGAGCRRRLLQRQVASHVDVAKHSSKLEAGVARGTVLDGEIAALQSEPGALPERQSDVDNVRAGWRTSFAKAKEDLELMTLRKNCGTSFVQQPAALELHQSSSGAGTFVVGILEVTESDFSQSLADLSLSEDEAEAGYQMITQESKLSRVCFQGKGCEVQGPGEHQFEERLAN